FEMAGESTPLIVETYGSRPVKIEGNPSFLPYGGATGSHAQASVLEMYDPQRLTTSTVNGGSATRAGVIDSFKTMSQAMSSVGGAGYALITRQNASPTKRRLITKIKEQCPDLAVLEYEAADRSTSERALSKYADKPVKPIYKLSKAKRVLSFANDFVSGEPGSLSLTRGFANGRRVDTPEEAKKMNRLYVAEPDFTLTGGMADHRLRIGQSQIPALAALIAAKVFELAHFGSELVEVLRSKGSALKVNPEWIDICAQDLFDNRGSSIVLAGACLPEEVHVLTAAMNAVLQAEGKLVSYVECLAPLSTHGLDGIVSGLKDGRIKHLIVLEGNPVYDTPVGTGFAEAVKSAETITALSYYSSETTELATTCIAETHYLEAWGDGRANDGTVVPVQPMIEPLFKTFTALELLAALAGETDLNGYNQVQSTIDGISGGDKVKAFKLFLAEGILEGSEYPKAKLSISADKLIPTARAIPDAPVLTGESLEAVFTPSAQMFDGRFANNGWLHECPDSMTKLTWDNAITISPRLAKELEERDGIQILPGSGLMQTWGKFRTNVDNAKFKRGKQEAPVAELTVDGRTIKAPVYVLPGLSNYSIILPLGYGRRVVGPVGQGTGFDFYSVQPSQASVATGVQIKMTEDVYILANTQEHWSMEGRAILREATTEYFKKTPDFATQMGIESHSPPVYGAAKNESIEFKATKIPRGGSLYKTPEFTYPQQWGMTIDLNVCTGCNACVIACQSENNIPIVGKDQVLRGREMHWVRLDRYFAGDVDTDPHIHHSASADHGSSMDGWHDGVPEDVQVSFMGISCQHCELAPCEQVCPVNATVHDDQGLNVMAYNRCVGTRYCANNCPYKVRRFNFFDWNKRMIGEFYKGPLGKQNLDQPKGELIKMRANPNVTVRMRGVMEKCTYCVQRIQEAKIRQKSRARNSADIKVRDGAIRVACQSVCPVGGVEFGDIADPTTRVSQAKRSKRDYSLLGYLNARPRTTYLAKLRNPNPDMPGAYAKPYSLKDYKNRYGHADHGGDHASHGKHDDHGHDHKQEHDPHPAH
ncbi:MAG: 4Fe-4S dicluster domain-containing protein, partial [Verrucomicrobiota bacterium]